MSWDYKTLNELGTVSRGKSRHRPRNDNSLFGGKYPFVQTADVKAANFYLTDYTETYNEKGLEQSRLWKAGTLCITIAANIADTAILGIDACFPDSIMGFVPYEGVSNAKFIKYAFDMLQRDIKQISQGTAQDNLSWQKLETIKFPAPDIKIQNKIVEILGTFDDLIENNQKQIKLLEEAAQRLYKEWFVDLRFPGFLMLSNGVEAKVGTLGSKYEFFHEWKRLSEQEQGSVALETMLRGICKKENFLDLLEDFILFDHSGGKTVKILARNHQYLGVNEAVRAYEARKLNNGKLGVFWHTQGSGKSYSMVFLSQKIRRKFAGSPTIVVLTDREELNSQISDTFENCGLLGKTKASKFIATSGEDLINKLKGNPSFIFTLIQKFNKKVDEPIIPDHDIIIMSDEAHRSQYGVFADNMVELLPTASRIGFTGTPLLSNDNITERTFGGYISIYDFKRAVEDKATVPLYYENRGEKILDINNPDITDKILDAIEAADLDPEQEEKLEHEFEKEIHLLTAEPRLESVARDFVSHYSDLWTSGKAMFVCLNKVTCVRMYDFVQKYWQDDIKALEKQIQTASQQEVQELERKLNWMKETEMAVVISQEQNEIQTFKKWNLDIKYHREKMEKRDLDKEFKDKDNPLRVVFVCAMWLTGFDVKCLSCLYLDKPLKAHTLMQTIARANRVAEGKAEVDTLIGKILWEELPESYSDQRIFEYRKLIFEYVFMRYKQVA